MKDSDLQIIRALRARLNACPERSGREAVTTDVIAGFLTRHTALRVERRDGWLLATRHEADGLPEIGLKAKEYGEERLAREAGVGLPTLRDMISELQKPGRDPRDELPQPVLRTDVLDISDLKPGMELTGTVRNVIDFGAFVDIGVHQDGLVHISRMSSRFIRNPAEVVKVGDVVRVWVVSVDEKKKRIALTMVKEKME